MPETLLRVVTEYVTVEVQGSAHAVPALVARGTTTRAPRLRLSSSDGRFDAQVRDGLKLESSTNAPALYEEATYWFVVESRIAGVRPQVSQRDPTVIARRNELESKGIVALTVIYRRQVGLSEWRFTVGDNELTVEFEVFPTKVDYDLDYEALIEDLSDANRSLVFEYFRGTHKRGGIDKKQNGQPIEWILLLRNSVDLLARAIEQVNRAPHRGLRRERSLVPIQDVRVSTPSIVRAISRGEGEGPTVQVGNSWKAHSRIPASQAHETLDTFEHRWLRSRLSFVYRRLLLLQKEQDARVQRATKRGARARRLVAEQQELDETALRVSRLLALPVISSATLDVSPASTSLQLQTASGYREAYQVLTSLGSALTLSDDHKAYSLSDINELYEAWCFSKLSVLIAEALDAEVDISNALVTTSSGLRFALAKGRKSQISLTSGPLRIELIYNPEYSMPTGKQRPDIVVRSRVAGSPERLIALDAKYRLDVTEEYVAQFGSPGAPTDAVNELHRYRDAIRPFVHGKRAPAIVAGAALFPWPEHLDSRRYALRRSLDEVGIGALPFLPGNEVGVVSWLLGLIFSDPAS